MRLKALHEDQEAKVEEVMEKPVAAEVPVKASSDPSVKLPMQKPARRNAVKGPILLCVVYFTPAFPSL